MFAPPPIVAALPFAALPEALKLREPSPWSEGRGWSHLTSFLEGPSFDRMGNLYCVDIPYGRIFRIAPTGAFELVIRYDGEPNGLKIHRDGRLFVADRVRGIVTIDPATGTLSPFLSRVDQQRLGAPNDLIFHSNGDLYFTDPGSSGLTNPTGRLVRVRADGAAEILIDDIPGPNGLAFNVGESVLYLAVTRANAVWRIPIAPSGALGKVGLYVQMSGGVGPDGVAVDERNNLIVAHPGMGCVWVFGDSGEPLYRIDTKGSGKLPTNVAFGGPERRTLYITESESATILKAELPHPGILLSSHR